MESSRRCGMAPKKGQKIAKWNADDVYTKDNLFKPKVNIGYSVSVKFRRPDSRKELFTIHYTSICPEKHELDVRVDDAYINGKAVSLNNAERAEAYSAALNDYFLNHAE
jgi:hypothetical protein